MLAQINNQTLAWGHGRKVQPIALKKGKAFCTYDTWRLMEHAIFSVLSVNKGKDLRDINERWASLQRSGCGFFVRSCLAVTGPARPDILPFSRCVEPPGRRAIFP